MAAISGELHTVPAAPPYRVALAQVPLAGSVAVAGFAGATTFAPPSVAYFRVHAAPPEVEFHASAAGQDVFVSYEGAGAYVEPDPVPDPAIAAAAARALKMRVRIGATGEVLATGAHVVEVGESATRVMRVRANGDVVTYCGGLRPSCTAYRLNLAAQGTEPTVEDFQSYGLGEQPAGWVIAQEHARSRWEVLIDSYGRKCLEMALAWADSGSSSGSTNVVLRWANGPAAAYGEGQDAMILIAPPQNRASAAVRYRQSGGLPTSWSGQAMPLSPFSGGSIGLAAMGANAPTSNYSGTTVPHALPATAGARLHLRLQGYGARSMRSKAWNEGADPSPSWANDYTEPSDRYGIVGLHMQGALTADTLLLVYRVSVFVGDVTGDIAVSGIPEGCTVRIDGRSAVAPVDGAATLSLLDPHLPGSLIEMLDAGGAVVSSYAGEVWGGATVEVEPYDTALQTGQGRAWLGQNGLRTTTFTPNHAFAP